MIKWILFHWFTRCPNCGAKLRECKYPKNWVHYYKCDQCNWGVKE